jgi:hypothetical protein
MMMMSSAQIVRELNELNEYLPLCGIIRDAKFASLRMREALDDLH